MQKHQDLISTHLLDDSAAFFERSKGADNVLRIHISRNASIALIISILVHLLLLITLAPNLLPTGKPITQPRSLNVSLTPPAKPAKASEPPAVPEEPVKKETVTKQKKLTTKPTPSPRLIAAAKPSPQTKTDTFKVPPIVIPKNLPKPTPEQAPEPFPGEDMPAYIKRQKEYQQRKQGYTSRDIADANPDNGPSVDSKRNKAISENLKLGGSNGIFEIKNMGLHSAQFSFKGWKNNNVSRAISEYIDVDVPDGGDVKLAIVRKMIMIIRREYSGDFNWESHRLDRVIVLSARREDNSGLESFLMQEFFGPGGAYRE